MTRAALRKPGHDHRMPAHLAHCTAFTRFGERDMANRKPFRTQRQKAVAKRIARRCDDGAFRSAAPVSFHD